MLVSHGGEGSDCVSVGGGGVTDVTGEPAGPGTTTCFSMLRIYMRVDQEMSRVF